MVLHPDDELLVEQIKKGSQEAFYRLVQRYQGTVYSLCYRMVGDAQEAEDLAQESFLRFYRTLNRFEPGSRLRPWLHRITANVCLDALRKRRVETLHLGDVLEGDDHPTTYNRDELPEEAFLCRELQRDVQNALLKLPVDYRVVLVLRYLEDLSYQEIAEALDVPVSTVETRLFRAKKMLGPILASPRRDGKEARHELRVERRSGPSLR